MKKLLSIVLALLMCWSVFYGVLPVKEVAYAVETGTAALAGERYTYDWTIPEIGNNNVTTGSEGGTGTDITGMDYEILGYVSPKYGDDHPTTGTLELVDGTNGSRHFLNDPWVGLYGHEENAIIVNLNNHYTNLSTVKLVMLSSPENGIFLPSDITIASSADGVTYNKVCGTDVATMRPIEGSNVSSSAYYVPTEYASVVYELIFAPNLFSGSYVMIKFNHDVGAGSFGRYWTFVSEVDVQYSGSVIMPDFAGVSEIATHDAPTTDPYDVNAALYSNYQIVGTVGSGKFYDTGRTELSDGVLGGTDINANDSNYVAITATDGKIALQIDLGVVQPDITSFELKGFLDSSTSYVAPSSVAVYASADNVDFYSVPITSAGTTTTDTVKYTQKYTVSGSNQAIAARYITIVISTDSASGVFCLDEFVVNNTNGSTEKVNWATGSTYKYIGNTANPSFNDDAWAGSKTDAGVPTLNTYSNGDLNNGIYATGNFQDSAWIAYNHASTGDTDYVDIIFDLGEIKTGINKVNFKLLDYTSGSTVSSCSVPEKFLVMYSNDDTSFNDATATTGGIEKIININTSANNRQDYVYYSASPNSVSARYILLRIFKGKNRLFIDEVEIWSGNVDPEEEVPGDYEPINQGFDGTSLMSAVWLSCFDITDLYLLNGTYQVDEQTYRTRLGNYLTAMDNAGINTILIHARSHGDRLYGSINDEYTSISPYSKRYTGSTTTVSTYDAFEIFIEEAHKKNISIHAWVNPLRLGSPTDMADYAASFPIKQMQTGNYAGEYHTDYINVVANMYWLNIGYSSVRQYIVDSVMEIVNNYNVDGVVIDDYFYPAGATTDFDQECYNNYLETGTLSLAEFRRDNATVLMQQIYKAIKDVKDIPFGISPAGNNIAIDDGYYTSYNYTTMYADIRKWVTETWTDENNVEYPYMDYVSPQLYWPDDDKFAYVVSTWYNRLDGLLIDWAELVYESETIKFMPSLGLYQAKAGAYTEYVNGQSVPQTDYKDANIIYDQLSLMYNYMVVKQPKNYDGDYVNLVRGQILYNSATLYDDFSSPEGYYTDEYFTESYSNDIRWYLKTYWQNRTE